MAPNPNKYFDRKVKVKDKQTIRDFSFILFCFRILFHSTLYAYLYIGNGDKKTTRKNQNLNDVDGLMSFFHSRMTFAFTWNRYVYPCVCVMEHCHY